MDACVFKKLLVNSYYSAHIFLMKNKKLEVYTKVFSALLRHVLFKGISNRTSPLIYSNLNFPEAYFS